VAKLLRDHRLVTLTGVGGCGKTRLALAVASELVEAIDDGVYLVELAPVTGENARVADVVADAVDVSVRDADDPHRRLELVSSFLARRSLLLVLDNCEHLLDAVADLVEQLLMSGSKVRVLATSREPLAVDGEQVHHVRPLPVGGDGGGPAVDLFVERAAEIDDEVVITADDRAVIAEICRQLDGLPLAIELAAAQLQILSPVELLGRLEQRFDLLSGGRSRRRQRQETLTAVMDSSWALLTDEEQRVLATLSVFSGSWTLAAAEGVCGPVSNGLRALVTKSLIEPTTGRPQTRFRMLRRSGYTPTAGSTQSRLQQPETSTFDGSPNGCRACQLTRRCCPSHGQTICSTTSTTSPPLWSGQ
jgi:predicted ATPase